VSETFRALIAPNRPAKTSFADYLAYSFGGFLLSLPVLPFGEVKYFFAIFTFVLYSGVFLTLTVADFSKSANSAWQEIWQIRYLQFRTVLEVI